LEFFIKDTGPGISEEHKHFIFERFRQGSESLSRNYEGAGLGLTISKAFVEMLGGQIWVESTVGKGSAFYFTTPYIAHREEKKLSKGFISTDKVENQFKKLKILIAEDNQISSILLGKVMGNFSKEVLNVNNGIDAVEVCFSNPDIDLVLMDIQMPLMDGYEATRLIRKFNAEVVIIAQSAFALTGDQERAIAAGCNNYISKPIQQKHLMELISVYFKQEEPPTIN
jgi:CheY-like chemotaxis protein